MTEKRYPATPLEKSAARMLKAHHWTVQEPEEWDPIVTYEKGDDERRHYVDPGNGGVTVCGLPFRGWMVTFPDAGITCQVCAKIDAVERPRRAWVSA